MVANQVGMQFAEVAQSSLDGEVGELEDIWHLRGSRK